ncbi:MAG TPA: glycosyl hydrolase family 79 C-terminal domain-containing protein, partial [Solirubrobacteraceae bacterium]|nr:glycosyl hydrolase family 79 C-terminal domain-containing protein [Solirubrobacteraceae bacterium]
ETGWRFLLSVNLAHFDPGSAAQEAAAAESILGTSLAGIEIGNEPDRYPVEGLRPASWWSFDAYRHEVDAYRSAIDDAAPGVPIAGPDASSGEPPLSWVRDEGRLAGPSLLTDHYYPLTLCGGTTVALGDLVSASTRASESAMLAQLVSLQRVSGIPLRLDETNNVSCKGAPGVSSTFAAALWAADFIGRAARAGLAGVNLMDRLERVVDPATGAYSPLALTDEAELRSGRLHVYPEWYALLLTRSLAGTRPLGTRVLGAGRLTASAFLGADGSVQVLLVDFDPPGARGLRVRVSGAWRAGTVLRLTASSLGARGGVTLGRRSVGADGAWAPVSPLPRVYVSGGRSELSVAPSSAALVTLYR